MTILLRFLLINTQKYEFMKSLAKNNRIFGSLCGLKVVVSDKSLLLGRTEVLFVSTDAHFSSAQRNIKVNFIFRLLISTFVT